MKRRNLAAALLLAAPALAQAPPQVLRHFKVQVRPPDMLFRFSPEAEIPGEVPIHLVLSGGGARGMAHIGLLQRLQEEGYPVRSITGNSIGALMGALTALGYDGAEIEALFREVDFERAFLDALRRHPGTTFAEQARLQETLFTLAHEPSGWTFTQGIPGKQVQRVLEGLFARGTYFSGGDFDRLRVPLRIVASNLQTGEARVFAAGDLVEATRASMALPGAFRPVEMEGSQFVDGALVENLPVRLAKTHFPEGFHLAFDISSPLAQRQADNLFSIAARSLDVTIERAQWESRRAADLLVRPTLPGGSFTSYRNRLQALVDSGRRAFDGARPALEAALRTRGAADLPLGDVQLEIRGGTPDSEALLRGLLARPGLTGRDVQRALGRLLESGLAARAEGQLLQGEGRPRLCLELEAHPVLRDVEVLAPPALMPGLRHSLLDGVGRPFNPRTLGRLLAATLHAQVRQGHPLMEARGTRWDPATGRLVVHILEPAVARLRVEGSERDRPALRDLLGGLVGQPLATPTLQRALGLAEQRLHLDELRPSALPLPGEGPGKVLLAVRPTRRTAASLDLALGWETTLGGSGALQYRAYGLGVLGSELEVEAARNRFEDGASLTLRGPFHLALGWGLELQAVTQRQRLKPETDYLPWNGPWTGRLHTDEALLRTYIRFGKAGTGKATLEAGWRKAYLEDPGGWRGQRTFSAMVATEWDTLDRVSLPTEGILLQFRGGAGRIKEGSALESDFRVAALRGLYRQPLASWLGLSFEGEAAWSHRLPLDRWFALGGTDFLVGTRALSARIPGYGALRLGLPFRFQGPYGTTLELGPRLDTARLSSPFTPGNAPTLRGAGLVLRTTVFKFPLEAAFGTSRLQWPGGNARTATTFNVQIGPRPFGFWRKG